MPDPRAEVAVFGAGAWGTAVACHLASRAHARPRVVLIARTREHADALRRERRNERYLPGIALPDALEIAAGAGAARHAELILVATPIGALEGLVDALVAFDLRAPLVWLSKGFVAVGDDGAALAHRLVAPRWPSPVGVLSGPSFADEVARGLPTALAAAATDPALAARAAELLRGDMLRVYETDDLVGVEVGGAVKNVLAIAAGLSDGLGYGHNARAALITRGLAEISRLAVAEGGRRETLMGLAGLGDLVLTCTGDASRNRQVGLALARGQPLDAILARLGHVAEGVHAARAARVLAHRHAIEMPITEAIARVLEGAWPVREAVEALLRREPRGEER
ncbi:MAG: NAD(P)H-dependent glycerol-3-phosphate dehydrogenase [Betaproteobacteria bacterium]